MANAQTPHSVELRRKTAAQHNQRIASEGERLNGGLFGEHAQIIRELAQTHGSKMDAVRFLINFYQKNHTQN